MTKEQSIEILTQALNAAAKGGIFTLQDSAVIVQALTKINELVEIIENKNN